MEHFVTTDLRHRCLVNPRFSSPSRVYSVVVGLARRTVPARVVAGGTNVQATMANEAVAPLHAARTSRRDVPTTLIS